MKDAILTKIPADAILEVCTCGHVCISDDDRESHMQAHYDSYRESLALRTREAMGKVYPISCMTKLRA